MLAPLVLMLALLPACQGEAPGQAQAGPAEVQVLPSPTQGQGVIEARRILDAWDGERTPLARARQLLERELAANPRDHESLVQLARYAVMTGDLGGNNGAVQLLERAEAAAPDYAETFVLKGHVLTNMQFHEAADRALLEAERLGSDSPWLPLNRAALLQAGGQNREAAALCAAVIDGGTDNPKALISALHCRARYRSAMRDWQGAESDYRAALERSPGDAIGMAKYVFFLCFHQDRCHEAEELVAKLRATSRMPDVDTVDTLVRYDAWGRLAAAKGVDSLQAQQALAAARELLPELELVMPRYAGKQGNEPLLKALLAKGVDVESLDSDQTTALMDAARAGHVESMRVLVAHGADVNRVADGWSALMFAASNGYLDAAQTLVELGADERSLPGPAATLARESGHGELAEFIEAKFPAR